MTTLYELSGWITGLSGEVYELTTRVTSLEATFLTMPSLSDYNTLSQSITSRFNTINSTLSDIEDDVTVIKDYIINLKTTVISLNDAFTGHTGEPIYTGSGAHGGFY